MKWKRKIMQAEVGDEVYLRDLKTFGEVVEVLPGGNVSQVKIRTPDGPKIVDTLHMVVEIVAIVRTLLPALGALVREIKSWFKGKGGRRG